MSILHRVHHHAKRHYEKHYRAKYQERAHLVFLLDAFLVSCALALLALGSYFSWFYHPLRDTFHLNITSVGETVGGRESEIGFTVENVGKRTLSHSHVSIYLPKAFLAEDGRDGVRQIEIGELAPGDKVDYRFHGFPIGPPQTDRIVLHFTASDGNGFSDEKLAVTELHWDKNLIGLDFALPGAAVPGQNAAFRLHVKNGSPLPFAKAAVKPVWPTGFQLLRSSPPVYQGVVALGDLEPGQEADLEFTGRFGGSTDPLHFEAEMTGEFDGQPFTLADAKSDVRLVNAGLKLEAVFPEPAPAYVKAGQEIPVTVRYRNDGDKAVARLKLSIKPDPVSIASVRWDDGSVIDGLPPGASGERTAYVRLPAAISRYAVNPMFKAVPQATFDVAESGLEGITIDGAAASAKIAGDAKLRTAARYFTGEGDQIGRGPLPPKVGKSTTYWILASLQTGASDVQNGVVSFTLPAGVAWTGRSAVTAGEDLRLEGDRLTWQIGAISAHAGTAFEAPSASFEISLTPSASQVGTSPALLKNAVFTGVDAWTGIDLTSSQGGLDTQLPGDPRVAGRTVVQR